MTVERKENGHNFLFLSSTDTQINQALINSLQASQIYHHHHYALRDHDHHHHQLANTGWILGSFFTLSETTRGKTGGMNWVNFKSRAFLNIIIIKISVLLKINIKVFLIEVTINNKSVGGAIVDEREFKVLTELTFHAQAQASEVGQVFVDNLKCLSVVSIWMNIFHKSTGQDFKVKPNRWTCNQNTHKLALITYLFCTTWNF